MESERTNKDHDIAIALIQKDIEYIKNTTSKIELTLAVFEKNFAKKDELKEIEKLMLGLKKDFISELSTKVNQSEFDPIKKTLNRINWIMISGVVVALLNLIIK